MTIDSLFKHTLLATAMLTTLAACGGSSNNVSPGSIVVGDPNQPSEPNEPNEPNEPDNPGGGTTVASVIPASLGSIITATGNTTTATYGSRPIYQIDVSALPGGNIDPGGLLLGNDYAFVITGGGPLRVSQGNDCVLEMAPGAILSGGADTEFLVIEQGCRIDADGAADQPILFTALADLQGTAESNDRGLWGGVVLNGYAPINDCPEGATGGTPQCIKEGEANSGTFGGDDPTDNSGVLRYVVVKYAGSNVDPENQLNGIAFQGIGNGTQVDFVQVHNNLDDGVEFFGGTVNVKHLVLTGNADDSMDWTDGWTGNVQFVYIQQAADAGDNGIEADNREGNVDAEPRSMPSIANMSIYGNPAERGILLRRGTGLHLYNSYVDGSAECLEVRDDSSRNQLGSGITIAGTSFSCTQMHGVDEEGAVEAYLDSADEVSQNGGAVSAVPTGNSYFTDTTYLGAFGATNWTAGWTVAGSVSNPGQPDFGCPAGTSETGDAINGRPVCQLSGTLTGDILLTSGNYYSLDGKVTVGGDNTNPATLSIEAGTTVFGSTDFDFLVISRGSKIIADGDRMAPIVFTSIQDENLEGGATSDSRGLWGGLVLNGNAPINDCPEGATGGTAQCTKEGEANSGTFGGGQPNDNSGVLKYVVVKYAGSNVDPENQLNGIAFQGIGNGTQVDFVQVHNNLDDGVEFFGGTVNVKHLILTGNADDSMDWTDGWAGNAQFVYIQQAADAGDNGIEADNREGNETAEPRSMPSIANMTIVGNPAERAIRLRRGTGLHLYNSIVTGNQDCLLVEGDSLNQLERGISFDGVSFGCPTVVEGEGPDAAAVQAKLDNSNVSQDGSAVPPANLSGDAFFDDTDFLGAVRDEANNWTSGWTVGVEYPDVSLGCPDGTTKISPIDGSTTTCELTGTYVADLTLTRGNYYVLDGKVVIGGDNTNSAILRIESGVVVIGDDPEDFLVISRGSQIRANGTNDSPVTFTAAQDVTGSVGANVRGLWGGVVLNGNAPINDCPEGATGGTVQCIKEGEANSGIFGGADPADNSGVLRYVMVKYAGSNVDPENQLNGIAFQGIGNGTQVDFVQVHNNLDDGVEFFGGTVNVKHLILTGNADDSMDWTDGWVGNAQFVYIQQAADAGDNGIEADNREGNETAEPRSMPSIANMTIVGNPAERAIRLRRGTGLHLYNAAVGGSESCLLVEGDSLNQLQTGIRFDGVAFGCPTVVEGDGPDATAVQNLLDGSNVTEDGSLPPAGTLPGNGFFQQNNTIGAGVGSWKGNWAFGL